MEENNDFEIYFVRFRNEDPQDSLYNLTIKAYNFMTAKGYRSLWVEEAALLDKRFNNEDLFVFSKFEGNAFTYLGESGHRILSPFVIMYCDERLINPPFTKIPKRDVPIYSQCMRGVTVTASNLSSDMKREISEMVFRMCGCYTAALTDTNNFLVTDSVLTPKYRAAKELGTIKIVKPDWVFHCDEKYQMSFKRADDPEIVKKYELSILHGLTICVSGIEQREEIEEIVVKHGGEYSKALNLSKSNTYLLLNEPVGEKYKHARKKKFPCLRVKWLYDSIERNIALPVEGYELADNPRDNISMVKSEVDTRTIELGNVAARFEICTQIERNTAEAISRNVGKFMDDCTVHLIGFDKTTANALKTSAKRFGAMVLDRFESIVTHIIAGSNVTLEESKIFANMRFDKFVTINWFFACLERGEIISINAYKYDIHKRQALTSINRKQNSRIVVTPGKRRGVVNTLEELKQISNWPPPSNNAPPMNYERNFLSMQPETPAAAKLRFISPRKKIEPQTDDVRIIEPEPRVSGEEPMDFEDQDAPTEDSKPVIMFTAFNVDPSDPVIRDELIEMAKKLGAQVKQSTSIDTSITHLVAKSSLATERIFAGIAACVWIVTPDFIRDSSKRGRFVDEAKYQVQEVLSSQSGNKQPIGTWWKRRFEESGMRVFQGWVLLFLTRSEGTNSSIAVTRSGGADTHELDDFIGHASLLDDLLQRVKYAICESPHKIKVSARALRCIQRIEEHGVPILNNCAITKFLLNPPEREQKIADAYRLSSDTIRKNNARFN